MNRLDAHTVLCAALGEAMAGRDPSNALLEAERNRVMTHTQLPADMGKDRQFFEEMGITFGPVRGIFIEATLPGGWTRVRYGDNGYGWRILDEKGRPRIDKPAFYDECAYMRALRRYDAEPNYYDDDYEKFAGARVTRDKTDVIWETERLPIRTQMDKYGKGCGPSDPDYKPSLREAMHEKAIAWLDKHKPDWRHPLAYWDEVEVA